MFACLIVSFYFYLVFLGLDHSQKGGRGRRDFTFLTTNSDVVDEKQMIFTCFIIKMLREQSVGAFMGQFTKSENTSFFPS